MALNDEHNNQLKENNLTYKAANQSLQLENQNLFKENESLKIKVTEANLKLFDVEGEKIEMLEKENEKLRNNLEVNSFLLPPIEESKLGKMDMPKKCKSSSS